MSWIFRFSSFVVRWIPGGFNDPAHLIQSFLYVLYSLHRLLPHPPLNSYNEAVFLPAVEG